MRAILPFLLLACGGEPEPREKTRTTTTDTGTPEVWTSGVVTCADPALRAAARFDRRALPTAPNSSIWLWAGGALAVDLDGDERIDLVAPAETYTKTYTQTPVGTFAEDTAPFGLELPWGTGGSAADYDGDGDLDLYLTRFERTNVLLRNDGGGAFVDVTAEAGVPGGEYRTMSTSWADMDRDGDLDLFVGNYGWVDESGENPTEEFAPAEPSFLYLNRGDGTFEDASAVLPQSVHDGYTYVAGWHDLDGDGWVDLYLINDFGAAYPNVLLWNREGTLVADGGLSGLDLQMTGMGLGIGDLNADGLPDLLVPEWNQLRLLQSSSGFWIDYAAQKGVVNDNSIGQKVGWGAALDDMDNDGDLDGVVAFGRVRYINEVWTNPPHQPDAIYVQQPDGTFVDEGAAWGIADDGVGRGFAVADLNEDGWLDLFKRELDGPDLLYLSRCGAEGWLRVQLRDDTTANRFAIGARIEVTAGEQSWWRVIRAGGVNYASSGPPEVHFGLGPLDAIDAITVHWPDGGTSTYDGVESRQVVRIQRR